MGTTEDFLKWKDDFATGVVLFDKQHSGLINTANKLWEAMEALEDNDTIDEIIKQLDNLIYSHFASEEKRMKENNYPYYDIHKEQHNKFIEVYEQLKDSYKKYDITLDLKDRIKRLGTEWYKIHVINVDKPLGEFLKKKTSGI